MLTTNQKIKALIAIVMRIYNPEVMYTYTGRGENENEAVAATKGVMRTHLTVKPDDTPIIAIFRMFIFFFVCGRYTVAAAPLSLYPVQKDKTRSHLHIYMKPLKIGQKIIREDGQIEKAPYSDFSIPHYIGGKRPKIPSYTYGGWIITLTLTDQSYLQIKSLTRDEGVRVVLELAKFIDPKFLPKGGATESVLSKTEPHDGKKNRLHGVLLKPYKAEYYKFGESSWDWAHNIN
ncbi:MAG: hypothetical protein HC778_00575 [Chamaesiphon sp. CSU_1_12]|nr:hypothetical protein [Chamaesiphon sp. CSU_1_12]